ncbi:MAG: hypothetical protein Q8880_09345 [Bacteroidota bacterium]|nr:hypothetical protein [Bacteroidota bacterium]
MKTQIIGRIISGKGQTCTVKWDSLNHHFHLSYDGRIHVGKAISKNEAIHKAELFLNNRQINMKG